MEAQRFAAALIAAMAMMPAVVESILIFRTRHWSHKKYDPIDKYLGTLVTVLWCMGSVFGNYQRQLEPLTLPAYMNQIAQLLAAFLWLRRLCTFFDRAGEAE